ncbi:MAG: histidinol-phosphatase, partial [Saprospiraceae bacterium]|nr:histidinol-phosphatase [Saprospiraceae bacterium]
MRINSNLLFLLYISLFAGFAVGCQHKAISNKKWYKGNLHTHSFWSDGDDFPEMIMDWYKTQGYHFVALSEHNIIAEGEKWIGMAEDSLYRNAFQRYLTKYGDEWVTHKEDSGRLSVLLTPLEKYRPLFEEKEKFLIIPSEEITDRYEDKHLHLNATNLQELIEPQHGSSVVEVLQNNIDAVLEQRRSTGRPMIVHINHPNFHYSISLADMIALQGERFFEVFNGHPMVHNQGDSTHIGTEEMWDQVNIAYINNGKPLIYGLGTDDSHNYHRQGKQ